MKYIVSLLCLLFILNTSKATNYAVLVSAGRTSSYDEANNTINSSFWNDLYLAYEDLIVNKGYSPQNVLVFYADGTDFASSVNRFQLSFNNWTTPITDFPCTITSINQQCSALSQQMTSNDNLLFRWFGHGGFVNNDESSAENYFAAITDANGYIMKDANNNNMFYTKANIISLFSGFTNYNRINIIWMTCRSGSLVSGTTTINNNRTSIITSSLWTEDSWGSLQSVYDPNNSSKQSVFADFDYYLTSAFSGLYPSLYAYPLADRNSDGNTSIWEAYYITHQDMTTSTAQYVDACNIAGRDFLSENISIHNVNLGGYCAKNITIYSSTIPSSNHVDLVAQNNITMVPGVNINSGSDFNAYIAGETCGSLKDYTIAISDDDEKQASGKITYNVSELNMDESSNKLDDVENNISISPNPSSGLINIASLSNELITEFYVYDNTGNIISHTLVNQKTVSFDLSNYNNGTYIIKINTASKTFSKKIVKY